MPPEEPKPCPVCGRAEVAPYPDHERVYVINGQTVRMRFAACLHASEQRALHPRPEQPPKIS